MLIKETMKVKHLAQSKHTAISSSSFEHISLSKAEKKKSMTVVKSPLKAGAMTSPPTISLEIQLLTLAI